MTKTFETQFAGRPLKVEIGKLAEQANGAALIRYGETVVLVTATASKKPREGIDFFPLSVDYDEKLYSVGKIPGSFSRREGRPSEKAILTSRVIDRPIRPLFPHDMRNDVSIVASVLCVDQDNSPEITAMIGSSIAISISDIPFNGPTGSVSLGYVDGKCIINPNAEQREKSQIEVTLAGTKQKVIMIEAGAKEISEEILLDCIKQGHEEIKKIIEFIESIVNQVGIPKFEYVSAEPPDEMKKDINEYVADKMYQAIQELDKQTREQNVTNLAEEVKQHFAEKYLEQEAMIDECVHTIEKKAVRKLILTEHKRPDGRKLDEIRSLTAEVGLLPRTHGSALFSRGQTQVLSVVTLGTIGDRQLIDGIGLEDSKRYMHHYNFPGYSIGEAKPLRSPGRREIGHGALAERAIEPVLPLQEEFPYAIRVVSEIMSSNGSTSQGSVCGSTLSLMDAGVPIKAPVAGISAGLITQENSDDYVLLTDIQGIEDFFGDMDFKIAGTHNGITAIQLDIKIDGLTYDLIEKTFYTLKEARKYILDEVMLKAIDKPRADISKYAPKIATTQINPDNIKDVIGTGGKVINKIIEDTGVKIDIEEDGKVFVAGTDIEMVRKAIQIIEQIAKDVEVGQTYVGKVIKITTFGAFVEIAPGKEGLVHISKINKQKVNKVEDFYKVGDPITVTVTEIDQQGRINLSAL